MDLDYTNLENTIKKLGYAATFQKESGQLVTAFEIKGTEYPVFMRITEQSTLLQIVMFLPCKSDEKTLPDTLRLLNLFNRELDFPGFGYDEASKLIFYRIVLTAFDNKMIPNIAFEKIFKILPSIAATFAPLTHLVCSGNKSFNDIKNDFSRVSKR